MPHFRAAGMAVVRVVTLTRRDGILGADFGLPMPETQKHKTGVFDAPCIFRWRC